MSHPMLLVTDLDGTLVRERDVDPRDARALLRWQEAGNLLAVATGRSVTLARLAVADASAAAEVALRPDFVICASGTTLLDADGQVLRSQTIPPREVTRAVEYLSTRQDCAVVVTTLEGDYLLHNPFAGRGLLQPLCRQLLHHDPCPGRRGAGGDLHACARAG